MRSKQFYVSTDVYRAYWLLSKAPDVYWQINPKNDQGIRSLTPDEIVDGILRKYIEDNYPQLFDHQKQVDALEKQLIEQLIKPA